MLPLDSDKRQSGEALAHVRSRPTSAQALVKVDDDGRLEIIVVTPELSGRLVEGTAVMLQLDQDGRISGWRLTHLS